MTLDQMLDDLMMMKVIEFLDTHYIDTDYYLTDEAVELVDKGILHLEYIDNLSGADKLQWLDIDLLIKEENI